MGEGPIYLDHNATTPVHPAVRAAMLPWLGERWGNPSSGHAFGRRAAAAVARAREEVAGLIGATPGEIRFVGGGTEADNLVLLGVGPARGGRLVTTPVEHPAVALPAALLSRERGWTLTELPLDPHGRVDMRRARPRIADPAPGHVDLVSVILVQNETGVVQPVAEVARIARGAFRGVVIHSDAAQAVGKIPVDVDALDVDMLTIVGHKLYGPPGIAALYLRKGVPHPRPLLLGGGQEGGLRPGTEPIAAIVGLGRACALAGAELQAEGTRLAGLRARLFAALAEAIPGLVWTGQGAELVPGTLHLRFPGCSGVELLARAPEIAASTGSACHAGGGSPVLAAMGIAPADRRGAVRLSLGRLFRGYHVGPTARALIRAHRALIGRSPSG